MTLTYHEAKCIKEIVGTISSRLPTLTTNVNKDLIGIETRLQDLKSKLKIESGGVRIIGIWGVGGGGKTTLASAAYAEISHRFEAHCLLQNIREESNKHGLEKLQEKFLSLNLKADVKVGNEIEGRSIIERRLRNKSVLVVLDDVDDHKQLEALAGSHAWFGKGSRLIITTRDEHLLTRHADTIYEVSLLSHDEAMELFNKHAYQKDKPIEDYEMLSKDVVSYASGLPLALEILGSFLYDKNKDDWKSALAKLKCIPNVKVTERLKISYDGLEPDHQKLFLDIACFFTRRSMDEAMMVLDACNLHPRIGVKVLIQKSLIKVSDDVFGDKIVVHGNLLRCLVGDHVKAWDQKLCQAEFAHNHAVNRSTGYSPFQIVYSSQPRGPLDLMSLPVSGSVPKKVQDFVEGLHEVHNAVYDHLTQANLKYKQAADQKRRHVEFEEGDFVWAVLTKDRFTVGEYNKLSAKKIGPVEIVEKINPNAYRLKLPSHIRCADVFNVKHLLPYYGESSDDETVGNSRANFVYPGGNDVGPSVEERAILYLEAQDRVRKGPSLKWP
uniref:Putative NB-ARC, P-loop containing nucleoside triphosphate hydrolase n=1 Tax=Helianthus annuus TaxID=4232 RepID=A0A251U1L2_HELAN